MPTYSYECDPCESQFEEMVSMAFYQEPQPCPECGMMAKRILGDKAPGMVFKGDSWASKNGRIAGQMAERRKKAGIKQHELKMDGAVPTLAPNVNGERTASWSDAAKLAKDKGKDTSGYDKLARKEKSA
jgi:putative FmdB family regulatory protein